jgi:L-seryl-tRNA(Ser) seleniumtransferase
MSEDDPRRRLPSVDRLLGRDRAVAWKERWGRAPVKRAIREALVEARRRLGDGGLEAPPGASELLDRAADRLERRARPSLRPVLNATGVVLHTNLGRAPLAASALEAVEAVGRGYSNLEFDLDAGGRGSRYDHCVDLIREITGADAGLVVNNNAAAVSLVVNELAHGGEVVVSRGEMVEIGGSFRIPDVIARSGGRLRGVGTTNRTRLADYRVAAGEETALLLKVHPSNYRVEGFTSAVELGELAALGREVGVPVVHDLGSGLLSPELMEGFPEEPSPARSLEAGADLVTWSGDKLLGGPQAGVVAGREELIGRLRSNPLLRAFRVDKMTLAALEATLRLHRDGERAATAVPALRLLLRRAEAVEDRARDALASAREAGLIPAGARVRVERMEAVVGGGSYPGHRIESAGWALEASSPGRLDAACRSGDPPLVGRVRDDEYRLDFRTLLPGQEEPAARVLAEAWRRTEG